MKCGGYHDPPMAEYKGTGAGIGEGRAERERVKDVNPQTNLNCPEGQGGVSRELGVNISGGGSAASPVAQTVKNLSPAMQETQV